MNERTKFNVFILCATLVKHRRQVGRKKNRAKGRTENRVERDTERPSHRSTNHHRLCRRQRIPTPNGERHPRVHRKKLFRYPTLFCSLRTNRTNVYTCMRTRMCMCVYAITASTICYAQYVFAASYMFPRVHRNAAVPCQYAPDEYRPTFCGAHSKVSPGSCVSVQSGLFADRVYSRLYD